VESVWNWFRLIFTLEQFCQASNTPLPYLNKLADNAGSNVSFETVKARQRPEGTTELASATRKTVVKKTVRKEVGCFIVQRRTSRL